MLRDLSRRPVLISALPDDLNRSAADAHVVIDWDHDEVETLALQLAHREIEPVGVVTFVDSLAGWRAAIVAHYALPGGSGGAAVLADKAELRAALTAAGLSTVAHWSGTPTTLDVSVVDRYPVVAKPAVDSGGSRYGITAADAKALRAALRALAAGLGEHARVLVEEYVTGAEFSIDGAVISGAFHDLLVFDKPAFDYARNQEGGMLVTPPQRAQVAASVASVVDTVSRLARSVSLDDTWLHVEARVRADGSTELIEVNVRPGGGLYRTAIRRACGVDAHEVFVRLSIGCAASDELLPTRDDTSLMGLNILKVPSSSEVVAAATREELLLVPGVVDAFVFPHNPSRVPWEDTPIAHILMSADTLGALHEVEGTALGALRLTTSDPA